MWVTEIDDATDFQRTAQQVKVCLNSFSLLLIYHKYIVPVGKPSRRCFPATFWGKKSEMSIRGTKIDILWYDRFPNYRSRSQIVFKSSLNASNRSQIHRSSRKSIETMFSRSILGEEKSKLWSGRRKSTYYDATDYQPTDQLVKSGLNLLSTLLIHHKYIGQVGKPPRRCFPAAIRAKKIRNVNLGDENGHSVMRSISKLPFNKSNSVYILSHCL